MLNPKAMLGFAGVTPIATSRAGVTVSWVDAVTPDRLAVTVTMPAAKVVLKPSNVAALLTPAVAVSEEDQVTAEVRFCTE